jgi:transcription antitermination factor NusG
VAVIVECAPLHLFEIAGRIECPTYVPVYTREVNHARRVEMRQMPLYRRYFFAWPDGESLRQILRVKGVRDVLRKAGSIEAAVVPDAFVDGLRNTVAETAFELGDEIEIKHGSWKGFRGALSELEEDRVKVLFSMLGRTCSMWIDRREVARIPNADRVLPVLSKEIRL